MHPPRLACFDYRGCYRYFLTFCTERRAPIFTRQDAVGPVLSLFRQSAEREQFVITAFCFMPDHVHLLPTGLALECDLRRFVHDTKQRSGYYFQKATGRRLWQVGYYEHVLRDEEDTLPVVRYVLDNPLRRGLARGIGEYPFAGSDQYSMTEIAECLQVWTPPRDRSSYRR